MNTPSPLAQLRDIHAPADIGWWPIADTWWILLALALGAVIVTSYVAIQHRTKNAWRRAALSELKNLRNILEKSESQVPVNQLNTLVKRCLASGSKDPASLTATETSLIDIIKRVRSKHKLQEDLLHILCFEIYQPTHSNITAEHLSDIEKWVRGLRNE